MAWMRLGLREAASLLASALLACLASLGSASPMIECEAWRAEVLRRQVFERGEFMPDGITPNYAAYDAFGVGGSTKHAPIVRAEGTSAIVVIGQGAVTLSASDLYHPMGESHWMSLIWIENQDGDIVGMRKLSMFEAAPAMAVFPIPNGTFSLTAYTHCNLHGVHKGNMISVLPVQNVESFEPFCEVSGCNSANPAICPPSVIDYERFYEAAYSGQAIMDGTGLKHGPHITVHGNGTATVVVGFGDTMHPMTPGEPGDTMIDTVHWINSIWVRDQAGVIIAMKEFQPTDPAPATFTFEIPAGATELVPFEFCNKHGLFRGPTETLTAGDVRATSSDPVCELEECLQDRETFARVADCLAIKAFYTQRQLLDHGTAEPKPADIINHKHTPFVLLNGTQARAVVGSGVFTPGEAIHPMTPTPNVDELHYIEVIWVEDQIGNVIGFRHLNPEEESPATLYFDIPDGTTSVVAYEYCNTHGLYKGPVTDVAPENTVPFARFGCSPQKCVEGIDPTACDFFTIELERKNGAAASAADEEHSTEITFVGTQATITVGSATYTHPMNYSSDYEEVHYIQYIYAYNDWNEMVAMCELLPTDHVRPWESEPTEPRKPSCSFEVPQDSRGPYRLKPFVFCSRHGLFQGTQADALVTNPNAQPVCNKRECSEAQPSLSASALVSSYIQERDDATEAGITRISQTNLCTKHLATFSVPLGVITSEHMLLVSMLTRDGDSLAAVTKRLRAYEQLMPMLKALGGTWHGLAEVIEHTGVDKDTLRFELLNEALARFSYANLTAGTEAYVDGVEEPIKDDAQALLLIQADFTMDWGHQHTTQLNAHYYVFHTIDFENKHVDLTLCAKTRGWLGFGWLKAGHLGVAMNRTDVNVAYFDEALGQAFVQDRFAFTTEEPRKDEDLRDYGPGNNWNQREPDPTTGEMTLPGQNDLTLIAHALGVEGKEWCGDAACDPGFTLVQYRRKFVVEDAWDAKLPERASKVMVIYAFAPRDPSDVELPQHQTGTTGYGVLVWNKVCTPGKYFNKDVRECIDCDPGSFQPNQADIDQCIKCPQGTFQSEEGQSSCISCNAHFTTAGIGAIDERSCTCSGPVVTNLNGWYHSPTCAPGTVTSEGDPAPCTYHGECKLCPEGMLCEGGFDLIRGVVSQADADGGARRMQYDDDTLLRVEEYCAEISSSILGARCTSADFCAQNLGDEACGHMLPKLQPGYSSLVEEPYSVFLCKDKTTCPGGFPGTCGDLRDNTVVACGECLENSFEASGECIPCGDGSSALPFFGALIGLAVGLTAMALLINKAIFMRAGASTTAGILAGTTFSALQTLTTFASLELSWLPNMQGFLLVIGVVSFNPDLVRPGCVAKAPAEVKFIGRILMLPFCAAWLVLVLTIKKMYLMHKKSKMIINLRADVANTIGALASVFFIPIVLSFLSPFICYRHPNGESSMISAPAILCGKDDSYDELVVMGVLAFVLIAVPFISFAIWGTYKYREHLIMQNVDSLNMFRFLFIRFNPNCYYFGIVVLTRNLLMCLVPIFTNNDPALQVVLMCAILLFFLLVQLWFKPWRPDPSGIAALDANSIDATLVCCCILLLLLGALTTDFDSMDTVTTCGQLIFALIGITICSTILVASWQRFFPSPFYKWVLACDDVSASAQGRLLKMMLQAKTNSKVIVDCEIQGGPSDRILDTIRVRTATLVLYGTKEVLKRQRVAGEICVATKMGKKMILIRGPDFVDPSDADYDNLVDFFGASTALLTAYGIGFSAITEGFQTLLDPEVTPHFGMAPETGLRKFEAVANFVMSGSSEASSWKKQITFPEAVDSASLTHTILVCSDPNDDEATATLGIMTAMLHRLDAIKGGTLLCTMEFKDVDDVSIGQESSAEIEDALRCTIAQARAILVVLSRGTLRSPTQLFVICNAMAASAGGAEAAPSANNSEADLSVADKVPSAGSLALKIDGRHSSEAMDRIGSFVRKRPGPRTSWHSVVPVRLPSYVEGPTTKYYEGTLPALLKQYNIIDRDLESQTNVLRRFFERTPVLFGADMVTEDMSLRLADIWDRIPAEGNVFNKVLFQNDTV